MSRKVDDDDFLEDNFEDFLNRKEESSDDLHSQISSTLSKEEKPSWLKPSRTPIKTFQKLGSEKEDVQIEQISIHSDTDDEKKKFFEELESKNPNIDYQELNEKLVEDSVDYGEDFEDVSPINSKKGDDLESIRSSLNDIESSLDMSDSEILPRKTLDNSRKQKSSSSFVKELTQEPNARQLSKELEFMQSLLDKEREQSQKYKSELETKETQLEKISREFRISEMENRDLKVQVEKMQIQLASQSPSVDQKSEKILAEQETLIRGYELENERMAKYVKDLEIKVKNSRLEFEEERQKLTNEISLLNTRLTEKEGSEPRERQREEDKKNQIDAIRAQFLAVEADLKAQVEKLTENISTRSTEERLKVEKEYQLKLLSSQQNEKQLSRDLREKEKQIMELKSQLYKKNNNKLASTSATSLSKLPTAKSSQSLRSLNADMKRIKALEAELFSVNSKCVELEAQLAGQQKLHAEQLAAVEKEKVWLQDEASARMTELRDEHVKVLSTLQEKNRQLDQIQAELMRLKTTIKDDPTAAGKVVHLEQTLQETEKELFMVKTKLDKLQNAESALESIREVMETLKSELGMKQRETEKMKGELYACQEELSSLQKELLKKNTIIEHSMKQINDLSAKAHASISTKADVETNFKAEIESMAKKIGQLEVENATLKQKLDLSEILRQTLTDQYKKNFEEFQRGSSSMVVDHKETLKSMDSEISKLKALNQQLESTNGELSIKVERISRELQECRREMTSRPPVDSENYRELFEQTQSENLKLKNQIEIVRKAGGVGVEAWQEMLEQLLKVETRIKQNEKRWKDQFEGAASNSATAQLERLRENYEDLLKRRDDQISRLRSEIDSYLII